MRTPLPPSSQRMKILVVGLGNPILTDDGVGVKVAYAVRDALASEGRNDVTVTEASVGGLRLMEMMVGYDRAILVDALQHPDAKPGTDSASSIPEKYRIIYSLNPIVGVIEGYRSCLLGTPMPWQYIWPGIISAIFILFSGAFYFKRMERIFVDVV